MYRYLKVCKVPRLLQFKQIPKNQKTKMTSFEDKVEIIRKNIKIYPGFPQPGINFKDIFSVYKKPEILQLLREVIIEAVKNTQSPFDAVAALDARGFLIGSIIALDLQVPFVAIRKKGKLPGKVISESYSMDYGEACFEIQMDVLTKGQRVLVVDDVLATGGSLAAACKLVEKLGAVVTGCFVLMESASKNGRDIINTEVISLMKL